MPPTQVADWAGNSVKVLLEVYAKCLDGETATALNRISLALGLDPTGDAEDQDDAEEADPAGAA